MRKTVDILGIPVDSITMSEAIAIFKGFLEEKRAHSIYTPNAEIMMAAQRDPELKDILKKADLLVADGAGVVLASKLLGRPVPEKVSGLDLVKLTFKELAPLGVKYFLLGSKPGVAEAAAENIIARYPGIVIAGLRDGYFKAEDEEDILNTINSSGADILIVCLGAPKQEKWIHENKDKLKVRICIGVGGTLDVLSGKVVPAPEFMRRHGFEWLYRLYREPRRARRMLDLPRFVLRVVGARLGRQ